MKKVDTLSRQEEMRAGHEDNVDVVLLKKEFFIQPIAVELSET